MALQRLLPLAFAAALTVGTCSATSVLFNVNVGANGPQSSSQLVSLAVDGIFVDAGVYGVGTGIVSEATDGWYNVAIDYKSINGVSALTVFAYGGWLPLVDLRSLDGNGNTINGLRADYYALDGTTLLSTSYGQGPVHYSTGSGAPWTGSAFELKLTGQVYIGADSANPTLGTIPPPVDPGNGDGDTGNSEAPEPAGWWLAASAIPLLFFSKLRLRRAIA